MAQSRSSGTVPATKPAGATESLPNGTEDGKLVTPTLPLERTEPSGRFEDKTITLYGPPKVGKSTLASQFAGGNVLFIDTEGGLKDLSVYAAPVTDWLSFLGVCAAAVEAKDKHPIVAIDTVDMLSIYCSDYINKKLGIMHESDLDWGKAWSIKRDEFQRPLAKLAATPGLGLIMISHAKDVEIKARNRTYTRANPSLTGATREIVLNMSDLILYVDFEGEGEDEARVIRTKPSAFWEAGERGAKPRLPDTLPLGYEALVKAWNAIR